MKLADNISALFDRIFKGKDSERVATSAALQGDIDELVAIERAAREELSELAEARTERLLAGDDAALDRDDKRAQQLFRAIERVDAWLPIKRKTLEVVNADARKAAFAKHQSIAESNYHVVHQAALALAAANDKSAMAWADATRDLGESFSNVHIPRTNYGTIVSSENVGTWAAYMRRTLHIAEPTPKPAKAVPLAAPKTAAPPPTPKAKASPNPGRASLTIEGPIPVGHVAVKFLRSGAELDGVGAAILGDEIALPKTQARELVRNGAAEAIEGDRL